MSITAASNTHIVHCSKRQAGIGLLEILLAVVILSIGFLASARMQVEGIKANQNALFVSQANFMLRDITDRMRANPQGVSAGEYRGITTGTVISEPACISDQTACNPQQIAQADLYNWRSKLHEPAGSQNFVSALPSIDTVNARGDIIHDAVNDTYTLTMYWAEVNKEGVAIEQSLQVQFAP